MSLKVDSDLGRFKDIVKKKVKSDIGKFISSDQLISQDASGKKITIPLDQINLPIFTYGGNKGGAGQGDGNVGDPIDGSGKKGPGKGKAGDEKGEHDVSAEFSPEELASIISEHLELPRLEPKGKGGVLSEKSKYDRVSGQGPEALKHYKRTFKEALKRSIASGTYDPSNPKIIPIKEDKKYKSYSTKESPSVNCAAIFIQDISGSMGKEQKHMAKSLCFWIDLLLRNAYKEIETCYIVHDTEATEILSRDEFFKISTSGGTAISSAYELCSEIIKERFPFSEYNNYVYQFSDGDVFGLGDINKCIKLLNEDILPNCNAFSYGQVRSEMGSGEFINSIRASFDNDPRVNFAEINDASQIIYGIKRFFEKGN
jgi:uncharacterized sporulation protein YeaH/YhbH (DUF444 family)